MEFVTLLALVLFAIVPAVFAEEPTVQPAEEVAVAEQPVAQNNDVVVEELPAADEDRELEELLGSFGDEE